MSGNGEDRDLRERFAALRREDGVRLPALRSILDRRTTRRAGSRLALAAAGAAGVAVAAVLAFQALRPVPQASLAQWTEPTAFLLRTPGSELLSTVPPFGAGLPNQRSVSP